MRRTFEATFDGRVLVPTSPIDLPVGRTLSVTADAPVEPAGKTDDLPPAPPPDADADTFADWVASLPPIKGWEAPRDRSKQVDHYLYGTPKRDDA